ncbi:MAG: DUF1256 domain-containing protein [Clostridia bacterium]|nr:DUF1256 domain-containing protein [Clostridia bacterium]
MNKTWSIWGESLKKISYDIAKNFDEPPVVLCLGSNKLLDDCLGPTVGSMLKENGYMGYVYGTLDSPIVCQNLKYALDFVKSTHKNKKLLIIDASTTSNPERLGKIVLAENYKPFNEHLMNQNVEADWFLFGVCSMHKKHFKTLFGSKIGIINKLSQAIFNALMINFVEVRQN